MLLGPAIFLHLCFLVILASLIVSLEWCCSVWHPHQNYNADKIEKIQQKAMLHDLGWRSLGDRRLDQRLILFYKIISGVTFVETESILIEGDGRTRAKNGFRKFRHLPTHLDSYRFSFFPATIRSWNQLTFGKDEFGSAETFKLRVKQHTHSTI